MQAFGTVTYSKRPVRIGGTYIGRGSPGWVIECEPHVRARLKRVFPRAPQQAADSICLSDTPENARELLWFLERYPMDVKGRDRLEAQAREHVDQETRLADLLAARSPAPKIDLAIPPREYQLTAKQMLDIKGGLLLADDVGTGKTVTAICSLVDPENLPAVVVYPAYMPGHWESFLAKFAPHLRVHTIRTGKPYELIRPPNGRQPDLWPDSLPDVIVVTYHKLRGWAETLGEFSRFVVFEECQQLRRPGSQIYAACDYVARRAQKRLGLSATPIYNYGSEFFWVIDVISPGALGERDEFVREWCIKDFAEDKARISDPAEFGAYLRREGIWLRRTRKDVGRELPQLQKIPHTIQHDEKVLDTIKGDAVALAKVVLEANEQFRGQKMKAAGEFETVMRQATGIAKAPYVAEFVRLLVESGERVVLFGWHRAVYEIWLERLADLNPVMYTGSESPAKKQDAILQFTNHDRGIHTKDSQVLIMSLRSGAGIDGLQHACRTVVFGELDWSPGVHEQCIGRVHRDGQPDPVTAYFLISDDGVDPIIADVLGVKREQIEGVMNPDAALAERIDTGEHHLRRLAREFLDRQGAAL